jgi:hypothetical protein
MRSSPETPTQRSGLRNVHEPAGHLLLKLQRQLRGAIIAYCGSVTSKWKSWVRVGEIYSHINLKFPQWRASETGIALCWLLTRDFAAYLNLMVQSGVRYVQLTEAGWQIHRKERRDGMVCVG